MPQTFCSMNIPVSVVRNILNCSPIIGDPLVSFAVHDCIVEPFIRFFKSLNQRNDILPLVNEMEEELVDLLLFISQTRDFSKIRTADAIDQLVINVAKREVSVEVILKASQAIY